MARLSHRTRWSEPLNRLTKARAAHRGELFDLTESNPTRAAISWPEEELREALARATAARYDPDPRGIASAREALAEFLSRHYATDVSPDDVLLTASTSEAYGYLFKTLCDPGDRVVTPIPSYPLLDHLAALESVELKTFSMELQRLGPSRYSWRLDEASLAAASNGMTRAVVVIHPNNPTGAYLTRSEQSVVQRFAQERDAAVISDEVFFDYSLEHVDVRPAALSNEGTVVTLGGLSKSAGLPHWKLGWIWAGGDVSSRRDLLSAVEFVADNFLSVATPVQVALPTILELMPRMRGEIARRTRENLRDAIMAFASNPAVELLRPEGGWSAVIRTPRLLSDEELALRLLEVHGVVVQPGYFFDFPADGFLVISLLTKPDVFREGLARMAALFSELFESR